MGDSVHHFLCGKCWKEHKRSFEPFQPKLYMNEKIELIDGRKI